MRVYNVKFFNCLTRGLKGTDAAKVRDSWTHKHPPEKERQLRPIGGQVRYCLFVNDRASPRLKLYSGDYIGGFGDGDDLDYIKLTLNADGSWAPVVDWNSGQDMDFALYDSALTEICHSWYSQPEDECGSVALTAGTYYAEMFDFSGGTFNATYRFVMFDDN